jgi:hypothetical protein
MQQNTQADFFLPSDLVARALASLAEQEHDAINVLLDQSEQGEPTVKDELAFHLRDYKAFLRAGHQWGRGIRPVYTPAGSWLVPSRTLGGVVHEVSRPKGFWQCGPTCEAKQFHWHTALILGIERAMELADQEDAGDFEPSADIDAEPFLPNTPAELGRRLAIARDVAQRFNEEMFAA